MKKFYYY